MDIGRSETTDGTEDPRTGCLNPDCRLPKGQWPNSRRRNPRARYCSDSCRWRAKQIRERNAWMVMKKVTRLLLQELDEMEFETLKNIVGVGTTPQCEDVTHLWRE